MKQKTGLRSTLFALLVATLISGTFAQSATPPSRPASGLSSTDSTVQMLQDSTKIQIDALQRSVSDVAEVVRAIANKKTDLSAPIFGLLGVLVGGLIQVFISDRATKARQATDLNLADKKAAIDLTLAEKKSAIDLLLAEKKSKFDITKSIVDWRLKQLMELYGPLQTYFAQSNAVYRTMNVVLMKADSEKFKLLYPDDMKTAEFSRFEVEADLDGHLFVIRRQPSLVWERFRTVLYIDEVYGKDYQVELYFDKIVEISGRIVDVIETKAGLALNEESGLMTSPEVASGIKLKDTLRHKFGEYLAHAAVLVSVQQNRRSVYRKKLGEKVEHEPIALNLATHKSAAFPQGIQKLVGDAYMEIQRSVVQWERGASAH